MRRQLLYGWLYIHAYINLTPTTTYTTPLSMIWTIWLTSSVVLTCHLSLLKRGDKITSY